MSADSPGMPIVHEDEHFFAIDKPAGFFVHPPESTGPYTAPESKICVYLLRERLGRAVYPAHRLDAPTSGLLLFANSRSAVRELATLFMERQVKKTYLAVVRGYLEDEGRIDLPLEVRGSPELAESITEYRTLARLELPISVSARYPTSRYSLLEVKPHTGRWHQIRRHFDRVAHPLIGDVEHGDSHHNRFFRDQLNLGGLCLRATRLEFNHPWNGMPLVLEAPEQTNWQRLTRLFAGGERPVVDFSRDVENTFEAVQRGKENVG